MRAMDAPSLDGQAGIGYRLKEDFFLPGLAFSSDELDALIVSQRWVRQRADSGLVEGVESAMSKILSEESIMVLGDSVPPLVDATTTSALVDLPLPPLVRYTIHRLRKLKIWYEDVKGRLSDRIIWPIALVYFEDVRVLAAWCEAGATFRRCRIDRIRDMTVSDNFYAGRRQSLIARWHRQEAWQSANT